MPTERDKSKRWRPWQFSLRTFVLAVPIIAIAGAYGIPACIRFYEQNVRETHIGGQTVPNPYYLTDDVQYFAPGSENKLANEAAAMKAFEADQGAQGN